jgi:glycine cleavage system regulatory protein
MAKVLKISSHDELIAHVPHVLGFTPESSVVCVPLGGGHSPTSRLDLPGPDQAQDLESWFSPLTDVYLRRYPVDRMAIMAYGPDGRACVEAVAALSQALTTAEAPGPELFPMLWVNGNQWTDLLTGQEGTTDPMVQLGVDAEFALMGRVMPAAQRSDLEAAMHGDPIGVGQHQGAALQRVRELDEAGREREGEWLRARVEEFGQERRSLSDDEAARVLAILPDIEIRDDLALSMRRADAHVYSELWHDLVRRAPDQVRDAPAAMLALTSFLDGRGAQAWMALDQVQSPNRLANLVTAALEQAVDPRDWDRAAPEAASMLMQAAALKQESPGAQRTAPRASGPSTIDPDASAPGR